MLSIFIIKIVIFINPGQLKDKKNRKVINEHYRYYCCFYLHHSRYNSSKKV